MVLTGCVPNRIYRKGAAAIQAPPNVNAAPAHFNLGIVEFDDMGEFWEKCISIAAADSCQLTRTIDLIRREKQKTGEVVVVVFTHGWKNNASEYNERKKNLHDFELLMEQLAKGEDARLQHMRQSWAGGAAPPAPRSYVGIYMGWRGQVVAGDIFATFWNRRDAAQRVGSSDFAEALYRIISATKEDSPKSRIVIVGHSFGARVVETALTSTFVSLLVPQPNAGGQVVVSQQVSPADLILYVNAATDSFRTKQMIELMKRTSFSVERDEEKARGPLFLSVTSTGDVATKMAFPLGQELSAARKAFRKDYLPITPLPPRQKTFFTETPGHIPYLVSHKVQPVSGPCTSSPELFRFQTGGQCFEMTPTPARWNDSPFWVVTVPPAIIRDHTDVFNQSFAEMIIALMEQYQVLDSPRPTTMLRAH